MTDLVSRRNEHDLWRDLIEAGAITPTGLRLVDEMPLERWIALGRYFGRVANTTRWAVGDWMLWGEAVYGEKYAQGMEATGLAYETLVNYASVCRSVLPVRRREQLSFSHHAEVAKLEPPEQIRWLDVAEREGLTRGELRDRIRASLELDPADPDDPGETAGHDDPVLLAARAVCVQATRDGSHWRVPTEPMSRLRALTMRED